MGLITGLLTLPLAPVRGTVWLAEILQAEAERQMMDEPEILAALQELEIAREAGDLNDEEVEEAENALVERLMELRGVRQEGNGQVG